MAAKAKKKSKAKEIKFKRITSIERAAAIEQRKAVEQMQAEIEARRRSELEELPYYGDPVVAAAVWAPRNEAAGVSIARSHDYCILNIYNMSEYNILKAEHSTGNTVCGFITLGGKLLGRVEAAKAAENNSQLKKMWAGSSYLKSYMLNYYSKP